MPLFIKICVVGMQLLLATNSPLLTVNVNGRDIKPFRTVMVVIPETVRDVRITIVQP